MTYFRSIYNRKSTEELKNYLVKPDEYTNDVLFVVIEILEKRGIYDYENLKEKLGKEITPQKKDNKSRSFHEELSSISSKELLWILSPGILLLLILFSTLKLNDSETQLEKHIKPKYYKGLITSKYIDTKNHAVKTIEFKAFGEILMMGVDRWGDLYDHVGIGDSIIKNKGKDYIILKKKNSNRIYSFKWVHGGSFIDTRFNN